MGYSHPDFMYEVEGAERAARAAGRYLARLAGSARVQRQKAPYDDLLDVDVAAEAIIVNILRENFPTDGILSEEVVQEREDNSRCWIVDPLDLYVGTNEGGGRDGH